MRLTPYDVLIPVCDAFALVKRCLESVLKYTDPYHAIWILDDASRDPHLVGWLRRNKRLRVIRRNERLGFLKNMNEGFLHTTRDVICLNSDTVVTRHWVEKLHRCRESDRRIGLISPLSNNALFLSLPVANSNNSIPISVDDFNDLVERFSERRYPEIPTIHGFCMLITREVLTSVGHFDPAFHPGYGEEWDLSMRAAEKGYRVVCCDDAFIYHRGGGSFERLPGIQRLRYRHAKLFQLLWPTHGDRVSIFLRDNRLGGIRERLRCALDERAISTADPHCTPRPLI